MGRKIARQSMDKQYLTSTWTDELIQDEAELLSAWRGEANLSLERGAARSMD